MRTRYSEERVIEAPAAVVYHLLSDYQEHHTDHPQGFLPPQFTGTLVERGGVGAGTVVRFTSTLGGRRQEMSATISEPEPGRVMVETGPGVETTFTVDPVDAQRARVRFDTVLEAGGPMGLAMKLFAPGMLRPVYAEEMARLERHAKAHPPLEPAAAPVPVATSQREPLAVK